MANFKFEQKLKMEKELFDFKFFLASFNFEQSFAELLGFELDLDNGSFLVGEPQKSFLVLIDTLLDSLFLALNGSCFKRCFGCLEIRDQAGWFAGAERTMTTLLAEVTDKLEDLVVDLLGLDCRDLPPIDLGSKFLAYVWGKNDLDNFESFPAVKQFYELDGGEILDDWHELCYGFKNLKFGYN